MLPFVYLLTVLSCGASGYPAPNVASSIPQPEQQQQDPKPSPPNRLLLVRIRRLLLMNSPWPKYPAELANTGAVHSFCIAADEAAPTISAENREVLFSPTCFVANKRIRA
jgi:hypothetical protein